MKNDFVYFHYHLNCQDINDNRGDNEKCPVESSQNTLNSSYLFKFLQINVNEQDFQLHCM